jgi:hypothetical protein
MADVAAPSDKYNLNSFRENLELILSGSKNEVISGLGISMSLVQSISPDCKIIDVNLNGARQLKTPMSNLKSSPLRCCLHYSTMDS